MNIKAPKDVQRFYCLYLRENICIAERHFEPLGEIKLKNYLNRKNYICLSYMCRLPYIKKKYNKN